MKNEIKSLTGLRGVAALYVALYHLFGVMQNQIKTDSFLQNSYISAFMYHGYISVDIFFILSAYVITLSSIKLFNNGFKFSNYLLFMKRRWARIYPIYFVVVVFKYYTLYHFEFHKIIITSLTMTCALIGKGDILGNLWSLSTEWFAYLLYPLLMQFSRLNKKPILSFCIAVCCLISLYIITLHHNDSLDITKQAGAFIRCFAEYIIGIYVYNIVRNGNFKILSNKYFSVLIPLIIIAMLFFKNIDVGIVIMYMALLLSISEGKGLLSKFLASRFIYFLGLISYSLYLIHPLFLSNAWLMNEISFLSLKYSIYCGFLLYAVVAIGISYPVYRFIEMPLHKYFKGLLKC